MTLESSIFKKIGIAFFCISLLVYFVSLAKVDLSKGSRYDLNPGPDAVEYFAMAKSMYRSAWPELKIGTEILPSRYPPGFSIAVLPFIYLCGEEHSIQAPYKANQFIGLIFLGLVCYIFAANAKFLEGGICSLLVVTNPFFVTMSRSCISDLYSLLLQLIACFLVFEGIKKNKFRLLLYSSLILGLSIWVRMNSIFLFPLLFSPLCLQHYKRKRELISNCGINLIVFFLSITPLLFFNKFLFGSPLKNGYDFWVPGSVSFRLSEIPNTLDFLWNEFSLQATSFTEGHIFGTGVYFVPAFILLGILGILSIKIDRINLLLYSSLILATASSLMYPYKSGRFFMTILLVFCISGASVVADCIKKGFYKRVSFDVICVLILFILSIIGFPSQVGYPRKNWAAQLPFTLCLEGHRNDGVIPRRWKAAYEIGRLSQAKRAIFFTDISPVYLNAILPPNIIFYPLSNFGYNFGHEWSYDFSKNSQKALDAAKSAIPVYALFDSTAEKKSHLLLPFCNGYQWRQLSDSSSLFIIYKLESL